MSRSDYVLTAALLCQCVSVGIPYDMLMDVGEIDILNVVCFYDRYISPPEDQFAGFKTHYEVFLRRGPRLHCGSAARRIKLPMLPTEE